MFRHYTSDHAALQAVSDFPQVQRLKWFTHGFLKTEQRDGRLMVSDLRMGAEPDYVFRYVVAEADGRGNWKRIRAGRLDWLSRDRFRLAGLWHRIWKEPAREQAGIDG
jgi:inner membrane protein